MLLGRSDMGLQDAVMLLRSLAPAWPSSDYDLLDRNCHHWSECAAEALGVCEALPRWVDRTAHCLGHLRGVPDSDAGGRGSSKVAPARDRGDSGGFCSMAAGYTRNHKRSDTDLTSLGVPYDIGDNYGEARIFLGTGYAPFRGGPLTFNPQSP